MLGKLLLAQCVGCQTGTLNQTTSRKDTIMARSDHSNYSAIDRFERRAARRQKHIVRRSGTRSAIIALALADSVGA